MKRILTILTITLTLTLTVAAQSGRQLKVYMKGGLVDKVQVATDASIGHSRTDLNGTVHDDYVSAVVKDAEGRERQYLISQLDSLVMPNGRRVVFVGNQNGYVNGNNDENQNENQNENENGSRSLKRSSFSGKFPGAGTGNVTFKWTENDRIRLDVGYESRAEQLSADGTSASFVFDEADDLQAERYWVYFPDRRVIIKSVQTQTGANNSLHIYDSGDCGTAIATRNGNDNGNGNENDNENENSEHPSPNSEHPSPTTYTFTLEHKAAHLCFLPHIDNLPSAKLTKITLSCSAAIAGSYLLSENGLYNASNTSSTITLNLVPQKSIDFFIGHDALTEQDSCAAYMVIAPQSSSQTFTATYYITDTLSHISKVYRQTFSLKPVANTVYPVTCHILDEEFRTIDLGLSCNWSNVNVGAREPSKAGSTFESDAKANAALLEQTVVTQWLMPDADQCEEILEKCRWTFGIYNAQTGYFVEGAAVAKEYGEKLRIFLPCESGTMKEDCLSQNFRPVEVLMVDLGLSSGVKWAVRNIGATSVEDYGNYYAWGEVEAKDTYNGTTYLYGTQNLGDNYDINGTQNDAAVVNWGGLWRMPTYNEMVELMDSCSWTWNSINGVNGYIVKKKTGGTDNCIFLPAAGYISDASTNYVGSGCVYMTSTQGGNLSSYAFTLCANSSTRAIYNSDPWGNVFNAYNNASLRQWGHSVRPVTLPSGVSADGTALQISTDSVHWKLGDPSAILYGTLSTTKPLTGTMTVGFVVGDSATIVKADSRFVLTKTIGVLGGFNLSQPVYDNIGYWYRAFVETADTVYYGKARHYGYEMVDLGLPSGVKWANMNLGADQPSDYGNYYAWGEITPKDEYTSDSYLYGTQNLGVDYDIAGTENDAAHVNMGNAWQLPTLEQMTELKDKCNWTWTSQDNVTGYRVTSKTNGNSIFLPAAGYVSNTTKNFVTTGGVYMSSTQGANLSSFAYTLCYNSSDRAIYNSDPWGNVLGSYNDASARRWGHSVRAVAVPNGISSGGMVLNVLTDSAMWKFGNATATLYGTLSSTTPIETAVTVGFIIGENDSITKTNAIGDYPQQMNSAGQFTEILPVHDNFGYWFRAYIATSDTVFYGKARHYGLEIVDLGLSVKWANMNVGASTPEEYGGYYAWGETLSDKDEYSDNYLYGTLNLGTDRDIAGSELDVAHANMGNAWQMPTLKQMEELKNNCDWKWTSQGNVTGYRVTSRTNGNSIFLPAAGYVSGTTKNFVTTGGVYMSSSQGGDRSEYAYTLCYSSSSKDIYNGAPWGNVLGSYNDASARRWGHTVRAVFIPNATTTDGMIMHIETDEADWQADDQLANTVATLHGRISSTTPFGMDGVNVGFIVGDSAKIVIGKDRAALRYTRHTSANEAFQTTLSISQNMGYWYRAFVEYGDTVIYGKARHVGWEMVDLGLESGTLWANMNVGANVPSDFGGFYTWGETSVKDEYTSENNNLGTTTLGNGGNIQGTSYDVALANMGSLWCMPTSTQMTELRNLPDANWVWTSENSVSGWRVTGPNGNSIFLPAAGYKSYTNYNFENTGGSYMTATQGSDASFCYVLDFTSSNREMYSSAPWGHIFGSYDGNALRYVGHSVRAVAVQQAPRTLNN